jgi:hypothetical protein
MKLLRNNKRYHRYNMIQKEFLKYQRKHTKKIHIFRYIIDYNRSENKKIF